MPRPGPNVTSDADTQPGSDSLFPTGFSGGGALVRSGSVGTGEIADGSVASADLNLSSVATALAARGEFTGTYAPIGKVGAGSMLSPVVAAGDSLTSLGLGYGVPAALGAYPAGTALDGSTLSNAGVAGNTSAQLLARFDTDVIAKAPKVVHILIGTNDAGNSVSMATTAANIRSMVAKCEAIGARVILGTIPPTASTTPTDRKARIIAINQWICRYALLKGIQVADYYRALVDVSTGAYASGYDSGDGVHPTPVGYGVMLAELAACLTRTPSAALLLPKDANDPWNYVQNGLFLSSFATGWSQSGSPTGVATTTVSGDASIQGNWGQVTATSSSAAANFNQVRATTQGGTAFAVSHYFSTVARVKSSALTINTQYWDIRCKFVNVSTMYPASAQNKYCPNFTGGVVLCNDAISPASSGSVQAVLELSTGTGDLSVAQFGIYDLTAMGVTDANGNLV